MIQKRDMIKTFKIYTIFSLLTLVYILFSCYNPNQEGKALSFYTTWQNPCFDRCASIWLMKNFADSTSTFSFIEFGKKVTDGIPFDVPSAELGRQKNISCFESIILKYELEDPSLAEMAKVIHDTSINCTLNS